MTKEYTEKDVYFIKKIHFVENIKKAIDSPSEESIKIYDELLEHREDPDIAEYLWMIYANKWWNCIELDDFELASQCFTEWLKFDPNDEIIHDGISRIARIESYVHEGFDIKHDFGLLRWYYKQVSFDFEGKGRETDAVHFRTPQEWLKELKFRRPNIFFLWLIHEFVKWREKIERGECCRTLLPKLVMEIEKMEGCIEFNEIIKMVWDDFSHEEHQKIKEQYYYYFYELKPFPWNKMYKEFSKTFPEY